ncbi:RlpA-like double-psi beta-barrel domain-containing protein [Tanacetum coccineum]
MIHLVIHLPLEALEGGPIRPRWIYRFETYMKKLINYLRNKANPEGSIVEGYVIEEALTFSNVDCPPPMCQFQVFLLVCKSIGLRSVIRFDHQELKKVIWYVLHNSPEIDTYLAKFKSSDECRTTQNNGICSPGEKDEEMYYGQLEEIFEFLYMSFKVVLFRVKWFDTSNEGYGQSIDVDAPQNIIDVDEDDDIIDDEDALPHDLADSDDEDLVNVDDDNDDMSADVARGHGGDGGDDDRPHPHQIGGGCQDPDVPRTSQWQIRMRRLPFGLIPRTLPGVLKMLETGQRARSYAGRDPGHLLSSKIGRVLAGRGRDVFVSPEPRCTHTADVDELKGTNKQLKKQMDMIMKVVRSDDKMSQLLTQLQSQHEVDSGSGSDAGGDDEPGDNEDAGEEDDDRTVAYRLELPEKLSRVHSTFHVSNLKKCLSDEPLAIPLDEIHIDEKLHFIEEPVEIMDREVKRLKQSRIPIVKYLEMYKRSIENPAGFWSDMASEFYWKEKWGPYLDNKVAFLSFGTLVHVQLQDFAFEKEAKKSFNNYFKEHMERRCLLKMVLIPSAPNPLNTTQLLFALSSWVGMTHRSKLLGRMRNLRLRQARKRLDVVKIPMACNTNLEPYMCICLSDETGNLWNSLCSNINERERDLNNGNSHSLLYNCTKQGIRTEICCATLFTAAPVLTVGHNAKKRKTSHSNWKGKAAKGKSDRGSKRKFESEIAPTGDPKDKLCAFTSHGGALGVAGTKDLKDVKDGKGRKGWSLRFASPPLQKDRVLDHSDFNSDDVMLEYFLWENGLISPFTGNM